MKLTTLKGFCRSYTLARLLYLAVVLSLPAEVLARVGGGQSYGGGGSHGGGGGSGGAIVWVILEIVRLLVYLTIEYPLIGIPLDLLVIAAIVYFFKSRSRSAAVSFSSSSKEATQNVLSGQGSELIARSFDHLRKFDPNFSEIV